LPLGEVPGVFMSEWASIQMTPTFCFFFLKCRAMPLTVPTATL